nr:MAG TPA: hypothetical protein [Caudoviricetes sp.]
MENINKNEFLIKITCITFCRLFFLSLHLHARNQEQHLYNVARLIIHLTIFREGVYSSNAIQQKHSCS